MKKYVERKQKTENSIMEEGRWRKQTVDRRERKEGRKNGGKSHTREKEKNKHRTNKKKQKERKSERDREWRLK